MTVMAGNELFVDFSRGVVQARSSDSYTRPISLDLRRAAYISSDQDLEKEMQSISSALSGAWPRILLALLNTPEGPPYRTAKVFLHQGMIQHKQLDDSRGVQVVSSAHYTMPRAEASFGIKMQRKALPGSLSPESMIEQMFGGCFEWR